MTTDIYMPTSDNVSICDTFCLFFSSQGDCDTINEDVRNSASVEETELHTKLSLNTSRRKIT